MQSQATQKTLSTSVAGDISPSIKKEMNLYRKVAETSKNSLLNNRVHTPSSDHKKMIRSLSGGVQNFAAISILLPSPARVHPKLKINTPGDRYEQEADRVAEQVMRMPEQTVQRKCTSCGKEEEIQQSAIGNIRRKCAKCEEEEMIQMKSQGCSENMASSTLMNQIQSTRGEGQAMDVNTRSFMEPRFGMDFSGVRIHADKQAAQMSQGINARAFTVGSDIYFNQGAYTPGTTDGKKLLAHELTHVVQQKGVVEQKVQRQKDVERVSRFKQVPPGPGAFTNTEYKQWQKRHPNSTFGLGGVFESESFYKRYTFNWFWSRGYFYSGRMFGGYKGAYIEVWLSNEGNGKEFRVFREITGTKPAKSRKSTLQEPNQSRPPLTKGQVPLRCKDVETFMQSICYNSKKICKLANELGEEQSLATCVKSQESCKEAQERSTICVTEEGR